jgi:hypothetical protein
VASDEIWSPITGFSGLYEVSNLGRVRNAKGFIKTPSTKQRGGYKLMGLTKNGRSRAYSLHRLVASAFLGGCPDGYECCHLNGDPSDNRASNLRYVSRKENHSHKHLHGTAQIGERHNMAKLTEADVLNLRKHIRTYAEVRAMARVLQLSDYAVFAAVTGKTWQHLPHAVPIERPNKTALAPQDIRRIRELRGAKTKRELAAEYGMSEDNVGHIWARRTWAHVA